MKKEEIYLDLRNLSTEQKKHVFSLLPPEERINYRIDSVDYYLKISFDESKTWIVFHDVTGLKEVNYEQFLTLFQPKLKIGDTFVKDGFICRVESKVEKWYVIQNKHILGYKKLNKKSYLRYKESILKIKEITDQEFINQLEKFSK